MIWLCQGQFLVWNVLTLRLKRQKGKNMADQSQVVMELMSRVIELEKRVDELTRQLEGSNSRTKGKKASKRYRGITKYLRECQKDRVEMTFPELESLSETRQLPESAYKHEAFWANTDTHSIALSWLAAGYKVVHKDLEKGIVVFEKMN